MDIRFGPLDALRASSHVNAARKKARAFEEDNHEPRIGGLGVDANCP
jgi:hypothetical protein